MHASQKGQSIKNPSHGIARTFQNSVSLPYNQSLALHPHLYTGLYNRASEIKALDKILYDLKLAAENAKSQNYNHLHPILVAIKDTLNGQPQLSWWNLFTLSVGHALASSSNEEEKNIEEKKYIAQISDILTEIIRNYRSPNTKLLLEIRLAALDVDSRLIELEKIPNDIQDSDETLEYVTSEFRLFIKELERIKSSPNEEWNINNSGIFQFFNKAIQLMHVVGNISETNPKTYQQFIQLPFLKNLQNGISFLLSEYPLVTSEDDASHWQTHQLNELFEVFTRIPNSILAVKPTELCTLLKRAEFLFIEDPNLDKKRPKIFSSQQLKHYISHINEEYSKLNTHLRAVIKGIKEDRAIKQNLIGHFRQRLIDENDLHTICAKVRFKMSEYDHNTQMKHPSVIQKETLNRMILLTNISQPKELDAVLKNFSDHEKEHRYFLAQEVILEQFIRWRKQGIY